MLFYCLKFKSGLKPFVIYLFVSKSVLQKALKPSATAFLQALLHLPPFFLYRLFYFGLIVYYVQSTPCSNEAFSRSASAHSNLRLLRFCKPFFICHRQRRACRLPTSHAQLVKHRTQLIIGTAQGL